MTCHSPTRLPIQPLPCWGPKLQKKGPQPDLVEDFTSGVC